MRHLCRTIAWTALFVGGACGSAGAQELTAAEEALIEAEVQRHIETYYDHYYERNMAPLPERIFHIPWILLGSDGIGVTRSEEEALEGFEASLASLLERDWDRSIFTTESVCVLNPGAAIVSGTNTRTREDGSVMSVGGVSYILGKEDGAWRIVSYAGHAPDRVVRCGE